MQFIDHKMFETDIKQGYFGELNSSFKSSGDDIQRNYLKKMQEIINGRDQLSLNKDQFLLKDLRKLVTTYKVLEKEEDRQEYLNMLRLRSLASQYNSITPMLKDGFFFPWLTFICK